MKKVSFVLLMLALALSACGVEAPAEPASPESMPAEVENPTVLPEATATEMPLPTATAEPDFEPLPTNGQRVEFQAEDGTNLVGYYYPAAVPNAPVIVLMHWAGGDQNDWINNGMVDWLQNRGTQHGTNAPSRHSIIYPPMPEGVSFAVFTFDFRGFGESSEHFDQSGGLLDAKAGYSIAKTLEGVDSTRMAGMGSSIGADGVVDGCTDGCLGALSFSPGSYLTVPYLDAVKALDDAKKPITCIASEEDAHSLDTCVSSYGENYQRIIYAGSAHGDRLFQNPPAGFGEMLLDWLVSVFEIEG